MCNVEDNSIQFTEFDAVYLERSYVWLTEPEIKRLTLSPDITKQSQQLWYDSLSERNDYMIWGVLCDGIPVGAVGLKKIDYINHSAEYFGYIGEKKYWGKGIGTQMLSFAIDEARKLDVKKLELHVSDDNTRAIALYNKIGFQETIEYDKKSLNIRHYQYQITTEETCYQKSSRD